MKLHRLTREDGNKLLEMVKAHGLDPLDFDWQDVDELYSHYMLWTHRPTGYAFRFEAYEHNGRLSYQSRWTPIIEGRVSADISNRAAQLTVAEFWLRTVKREHDTPDLWQAIAAERELLGTSSADDGAQFSADERKIVADRLTAFHRQVEQIANPTPDQAAALTKAVEDLKAAAETLSRGQWKTMFIGTIIQAVAGLALDPARAQQVLHYATLYIGPLFAQVRGLLS